MESHGSERRNLKRKPLADLTNVAPFVSSSSSTPSLRKSIPKPKPKPKPPQSSNPEERSKSGVNSRRHEEHGDQIVATPSPKSRGTFLDSVDDDAAERDKSELSIVYTPQATEGRRSKRKEAGRRCKKREAGRCKEKATPSTTLSCPPAARDRSMKGKLVMEDDKVDHPKAFSVPYQKAKKQQQRYRMPEAISKPILPQDFVEEQRTYFAEIDAFELPVEVVSESELE